jgi:hypothetical protein
LLFASNQKTKYLKILKLFFSINIYFLLQKISGVEILIIIYSSHKKKSITQTVFFMLPFLYLHAKNEFNYAGVCTKKLIFHYNNDFLFYLNCIRVILRQLDQAMTLIGHGSV